MIAIKNKRISKGMTQNQLAETVGVKQNTVSQWESGVRKPDISMIITISTILGCTVDELLGIGKEKERENGK